uniref:Uncharacterized protein n=1 Tax=Cannabis sativa TaxID=3483 RepID=A0A803P115_CANSA
METQKLKRIVGKEEEGLRSRGRSWWRNQYRCSHSPNHLRWDAIGTVTLHVRSSEFGTGSRPEEGRPNMTYLD